MMIATSGSESSKDPRVLVMTVLTVLVRVSTVLRQARPVAPPTASPNPPNIKSSSDDLNHADCHVARVPAASPGGDAGSAGGAAGGLPP